MSAPIDNTHTLDDALDRHSILQALQAAGAADCELRLFDRVDSTNSWLLQYYKECASAAVPLACIADAQSAGRGRRSKVWHSPPGSNLYLSLGWNFAGSASELVGFSLLVGVAVVRALKQIGIAQAKLKWPNDVLVANKKIAGILIETRTRADASLVVVIGLGLNYLMSESERAHIDQPCCDVAEHLAAPCSRNQLAAVLLAECLTLCAGFPQNRAAMLAEYRNHYDALHNQQVMIVRDDGQQLVAQALGIAEDGALQVRIDGVEQTLMAGDVSLRWAS